MRNGPQPSRIPKLNGFGEEVYALAHEKGWYDTPRPLHTMLLLVVSEIVEAFEDLRNGLSPDKVFIESSGKPCGFPTEIADALIRCLDLAAHRHIDLDEEIYGRVYDNDLPPIDEPDFDLPRILMATVTALGLGFLPESRLETHLADTVILLFSTSWKAGFDLMEVARQKHEFNKTRPYQHGGKTT